MSIVMDKNINTAMEPVKRGLGAWSSFGCEKIMAIETTSDINVRLRLIIDMYRGIRCTVRRLKKL